MAKRGSAAYELSVLLSLKDRASPGLRQFDALLKNLKKDSAAFIREFNKLDAKFSKQYNTSGLDSLTLKMRTFRRESRAAAKDYDAWRQSIGRGPSTNSLPRARRAPRPRSADEELDDLFPPRRRRRGKFERFADAARTGHQAASIAGDTLDSLRGFTGPAFEQMRAQTRFQLLGYSQQEQAKAFAAIQQTVREVKGVRAVDVQEVFTGLVSTMGSVNEAIELLPMAAKHLANVEAIYGDKFGRTEAIKQFTDATRAVELIGKDQDINEAKRYLNFFAQATMATGGDVNPQQIRDFAKYGQIAAMSMTPEGWAKFLPLIQQMNGAPAGTALTSLYSAVVGGRIPAHKLRYWEELGLVDRTKVEFNQHGQIKRFLPGAIPLAEGFGQDPLAFADRFAEVLRQKQGIDTTNPEAVAKQLEVMFGDRTAKRELAQMIVMRQALEKETANYLRAPGVEGTYSHVFAPGNTLGQILDFQAKETNARADAGKPLAELSGTISERLTKLLEYAQSKTGEHPAVAATTVAILSLGKASLDTADGLGLLSKVARGLDGSQAGGGGGIGGTSVDTSDVLTGGYGLWKLLKWGVRGGFGLATRFGGPLAIGTGLAYLASQQNRAATGADTDVDREAAVKFADLKKQREQHGGRLPDDAARQLGAGAYASLNRRDELIDAVEPKAFKARRSPLRPYSDAMGFYSEALAVPVFKQRAPGLAFAEAMQHYIREVQARVERGEISPASGKRLLHTAEKGFPESYKQATESLTKEFGNLQSQASPLSNTFKELFTPASSLPGAFNRVGLGADMLSIQLMNWRPPVAPAGPAIATGHQPGGHIPQSAVGSIIHRDGLLNVHKGNVIFPAKLSRRAPGDWLNDLSQLKSFTDDSARTGGHLPSLRTPVASAQPRLIAARTSAPVRGGSVQIGSIVVQVPEGSKAADDPPALAALVASEVSRQVGEAMGELSDPRYIANSVLYLQQREDERA